MVVFKFQRNFRKKEKNIQVLLCVLIVSTLLLKSKDLNRNIPDIIALYLSIKLKCIKYTKMFFVFCVSSNLFFDGQNVAHGTGLPVLLFNLLTCLLH